MSDAFHAAVPIIENKLYFVALRTIPHECLGQSATAAGNICYTIDETLLYEPFFADFGPLNLGKAFRFCSQTQELLQEAERLGKRLYFYCGPQPNYRANAATLIGIYQVIYLNRAADDAYKPLQYFKPYVPFRDASCGQSTFHLTVQDVLRGIQKARDVGFIDWNSGNSTWSLEEYEHYEQVENGDLNWIVPGKLVAFSGPANRGNEIAGYRLHTPEDYWDYWRKKNVTAIVRLNKKVYDRQRFVQGGFRHYDLYFPDGSCPSEAIVLKFLEIAESEPGALAVHCKAGLGRTGVLISCYCMKHFKFTAEEMIGYIRVCRPGSVIGPQQNFLRDIEQRMWHEGDMWRAARGINKPHLALGDLSIHGKQAWSGSDPNHANSNPWSAVQSLGAAVHTPSNAQSRCSTVRSAPAVQHVPTASVTSHALSSRTSAPVATSTFSAFVNGTSALSPSQKAAMGISHVQHDSQRNSDISVNPSDMSLTQYSKQMHLTVNVPQHNAATPPSTNSSAAVTPSSAVSTPGSSTQLISQSSRGTPTSPGASGQQQSSTRQTASSNRSITPMRYTTGSVLAGFTASMGGMVRSPGSISHSIVSRSMPAGPLALTRAPSVDRAVDRSMLRATLHTDTLRAADRIRTYDVAIERNVMSADPSLTSSAMRSYGSSNNIPASYQYGAGNAGALNGPSAPIPTTPKPAAPGHKPNTGVARTLAPNGQPRKVPVAMLPQYHAGIGSKVMHGSAGSPPTTPLTHVATTGSIPGSLESSRIKSMQMRYTLHSKSFTETQNWLDTGSGFIELHDSRGHDMPLIGS